MNSPSTAGVTETSPEVEAEEETDLRFLAWGFSLRRDTQTSLQSMAFYIWK